MPRKSRSNSRVARKSSRFRNRPSNKRSKRKHRSYKGMTRNYRAYINPKGIISVLPEGGVSTDSSVKTDIFQLSTFKVQDKLLHAYTKEDKKMYITGFNNNEIEIDDLSDSTLRKKLNLTNEDKIIVVSPHNASYTKQMQEGQPRNRKAKHSNQKLESWTPPADFIVKADAINKVLDTHSFDETVFGEEQEIVFIPFDQYMMVSPLITLEKIDTTKLTFYYPTHSSTLNEWVVPVQGKQKYVRYVLHVLSILKQEIGTFSIID